MKELPGWVVDDVESVRWEVADWIDLSPAERWRLAEICSEDAVWAIRASGRAEEILAYEDPLPESTQRALRRLRAEWRAQQNRG